MSESWFSEKIAPGGDILDGCDPREAEALKEYIHHQTTAAEAAAAITQPVKTDADPRDSLSRLWGLLGDALMELSLSLSSSLVQLLGAIQELPGQIPAGTSNNVTIPMDLFWRDLPSFGHQWSDTYERRDWRRLVRAEPSQDERDKLGAEYVRRQGVEAQLASASIAGFTLDAGYECICDALERSDAILEFEVPAATLWLLFAGRRIHTAAVDRAESWALSEVRDLWPADNQTLSLERWSRWEYRMKTLLEQATANHDIVTGNAAAKAVQIMTRLSIG